MELTLSAYGKINLSLYILGCREDGYHDLAMVMQSIDLHDTVFLSDDCDGLSLTCDRPELNGCKNLAYRAAEAFFDAVGRPKRAAIHIQKRIPVLAGLGGGSADSAAVLRGLEQLTGCVLPSEQRLALAASLGADVPFCTVGGTAVATGIGECLLTLQPPKTHWLVLIKAGEKSSTGKMFSQYDQIGVLPRQDSCDIINKLANMTAEECLYAPQNDFMRLYANTPSQEACLCLREQGAVSTGLTGSGPTVFGVFCDRTSAERAFAVASSVYPDCYITRTVSPEGQ